MTRTPGTARARRYSEILGEVLFAEFEERKISQREVARRIGVDQATAHNYTSGKRIIPVTFVIDACEAIGADAVIVVRQAYIQLVQEQGPPK